MNLDETQTLQQVAKEYDISVQTLHSRLKFLIEGTDYKKMGTGQAVLITLLGVEKIIKPIRVRKK